MFKLKHKHGENGIFFWIVHQSKGAASVSKKYGMFQGNVQNCFFLLKRVQFFRSAVFTFDFLVTVS